MTGKKSQPAKYQQARVLGGFTLDGVNYQSDDIIEAHPDIIKSLGTAIDPGPAAVDHCLNKQDAVIKRHEWNKPEPATEVAQESTETATENQ
ncbi:hypothetical protein Nit79A3_2405 [Nitrosomonas sp. Is79A3]|uniref:hypothetical protein n=1 Tax=Nitrosomonas sp. (strain Is79A3) TaxID=261292 RepID=UPI000215CA26